jgi:isopentenyl-diphosphate delta-isomerase
MEEVILVNELDEEVGTMEKLEAHVKGVLHRAISVFIFNSSGQMLLQRRAMYKYHSPGLWTNTSCSHPKPGETTRDAAMRRLQEEMGISSKLEFSFSFIYKATFENDLTEHELDHVFIGHSDEKPQLNLNEAMDYQYMDPEHILADLTANPDKYTAWFKIIMQEHFSKIIQPI